MQPIHLAFLWHQHQPFYKDRVEGRYVLPWVRLHAIKDYIGMLLVLREWPGIRCTINLVPSLIVQIQDYADGAAEDDALRMTRYSAADLSEEDCGYILRHFFAGNPDRLIRGIRRYNELFEQRNAAIKNKTSPAKAFSTQDYRDMQVWATLSWFHPLVVESDAVLTALWSKGRDFSEADKAAMLERQDHTIRRVLPLHAELSDTGQIELSTTPFYHPILPLLCNPESAREALPDLPMPERRSDFAPDAREQVQRAMTLHKKVLGHPPLGLWPSEGSVGMDMLPAIRGCGFRWIATDEGILGRSADVDLSRNESGILNSPDALYQPYALPGDDLPAIVFRDRALSDAIGFDYHRGDPEPGAENFVWRVQESAQRCTGGPRLVSVILDGENPWDYYGKAGLTFLRALYSRIEACPEIVTTRLSDFVEQHPPEQSLERLAAGSWIHSNFAIWIGEAEDRAAWSLLAEARDAVAARAEQSPPLAPDLLARAWEQIYIAEGSDWCWWFGSHNTSAQDYLFDRLFRSHLANAYSLIGKPPPPALAHPIGKPDSPIAVTPPGRWLAVVVNGRIDDSNEWDGAGHLHAGQAGSSMHRAAEPMVTDLYYGVSADTFWLRMDTGGPFPDRVDEPTSMTVHLSSPQSFSMVSEALSVPHPAFRILDAQGGEVGRPSAARADVLEIGCPLNLLAASPEDEIQFSVEITRAGALIQRLPNDGVVVVRNPASR